MDPELPGIGPAFGDHSAGFKPDQFGSARAKAPVTPERQFTGTAIRIAVAAFHGMDSEGISNSPGFTSGASEFNRPRENAAKFLPVFNQRNVNVQFCGVAAKVGEAPVMEVLSGHF